MPKKSTPPAQRARSARSTPPQPAKPAPHARSAQHSSSAQDSSAAKVSSTVRRADTTQRSGPAKHSTTAQRTDTTRRSGATQRSGTARAVARNSTSPAPAVAPRPTAGKWPLPFPSTGFWLVKSEPTSFSFDDLLAAPRRRTGWDGVRNFQARNFLRHSMRVGDLLFYYHSNAEPPGVAGVARVVGAARPDPTQFDPRDEHFDPKARPDDPPWFEVEVEAVAPLPRFVSLEALQAEPRLAGMLVLQRGQRLSVLPVQPAEWSVVLELAGARPGDFRTA